MTKREGVGSIWAVGRNYAAHAKELKNDIPTQPLIFLKSGGCLTSHSEIRLPEFSSDIHHELEIAVQFGTNFEIEKMRLALDLTARDLQSAAKTAGQPWTSAKSFIGACPVGPEQSFCGYSDFPHLEFQLVVNGKIRQQGSARDMIFDLKTLIADVRKRFPVREGDLLLTGTPAGVGPLRPGDEVLATWNLHGQELPPMNWRVTD